MAGPRRCRPPASRSRDDAGSGSPPISSQPTRISPETQLEASGKLWHGRHPSPRIAGASWEATKPPGHRPTQGWPGCRSWPSTALRPLWIKVVNGRGAGRDSRRLPSMLRQVPSCSGPSEPPTWPTGPGFASAPPPDPGRRVHDRLGPDPGGMAAKQPSGRDAVAAQVRQGRVGTSCLTPQAVTGDSRRSRVSACQRPPSVKGN